MRPAARCFRKTTAGMTLESLPNPSKRLSFPTLPHRRDFQDFSPEWRRTPMPGGVGFASGQAHSQLRWGRPGSDPGRVCLSVPNLDVPLLQGFFGTDVASITSVRPIRILKKCCCYYKIQTNVLVD